MKTKYTSEELAEALRTFIKSGSFNGKPWMRKNCLALVPTFAVAPELLEAVKLFRSQVIEDYEKIDVRKIDLLIQKAEGGK